MFRHALPLNRLVTTCCSVLFALCAFDVIPLGTTVLRALLMGPVLVYLMVAIGLAAIPKLPLYRHGDYSYGIYLYGYPLQQALVAQFPQLTSPWLHMAVSVPLATLFAVMSWHFIEKPILQVRRRFSFTARKGEVAPAPAPAGALPASAECRAPQS